VSYTIIVPSYSLVTSAQVQDLKRTTDALHDCDQTFRQSLEAGFHSTPSALPLIPEAPVPTTLILPAITQASDGPVSAHCMTGVFNATTGQSRTYSYKNIPDQQSHQRPVKDQSLSFKNWGEDLRIKGVFDRIKDLISWAVVLLGFKFGDERLEEMLLWGIREYNTSPEAALHGVASESLYSFLFSYFLPLMMFLFSSGLFARISYIQMFRAHAATIRNSDRKAITLLVARSDMKGKASDDDEDFGIDTDDDDIEELGEFYDKLQTYPLKEASLNSDDAIRLQNLASVRDLLENFRFAHVIDPAVSPGLCLYS